MENKIKLAIFACGRGSNLETIINNCNNNVINATVDLVISYKEDAKAVQIARIKGIETIVIKRENFESRELFDTELSKYIDLHQIDLICLAGYFQLLTPMFVQKYKNRIMNIHPSLLPAFPGFKMIKNCLKYGVKFTGCTVHFVDDDADSGPIIEQAVVPIYDFDTEESLGARISQEEHIIYSRAIQLYALNLLNIEERKVIRKIL